MNRNKLKSWRYNKYTFRNSTDKYTWTVKPVYRGHSQESENVAFMSRCFFYTG